MKKILLFSLLTVCFILAGCSSSGSSGDSEKENKKLVLGGVDYEPYNQLIPLLQEKLKEDGIDLEVKYFSEIVIPNQALANKEIDANYFQNSLYLKTFNETNGTDLVSVASTFTQFYAGYSAHYTSLDQLPDSPKVFVPADTANNSRALQTLAQNDLIKLREDAGELVSQKDIIENPYNFEIVEMDSALFPSVYEDADLILAVGTSARKMGLSGDDALFKETKNHQYSGVLAARPDNQDSEEIQKLVEALNSSDIKEKFLESYSDIAVWK